MTSTRIAIAVCIGCVGVMLLSACGFYLPQPPTVETQYFTVIEDDGAGHPRLAAFGFVGGELQHLYGYLTIEYPECPEAPTVHLTGALNVRDHRIKLKGDPGSGVAIGGTASIRRIGSNVNFEDFHLSGTLTRPAGCNDSAPVQVPFNPTPFVPLAGVFKAPTTGPDGKAIELSMAIHERFFDMYGRYGGESTINISGSSCFREGTRQLGVSAYTQNVAATSSREIYRMDDGSKLTAIIARPAWLGGNPFPLSFPIHFAVEGGACDKQTFDATLIPEP